jgi:hypothetical protein
MLLKPSPLQWPFLVGDVCAEFGCRAQLFALQESSLMHEDIIDDPREFVPHRVRQLVETFVTLFQESGIQTSAEQLHDAGFRFWFEGQEFWIYQHGQEVSMRDLIVEVTARI